MASPALSTKQAQVAPNPQASPASLQPPHINPLPVSQAASHVHSVLLLALFVASFDSLVVDPVSSMKTTLPFVIAIQAVYTLLCLPAAGSSLSKGHKKPRAGDKRAGTDSRGPNLLIAAFLSLLLSTIIAPLLHICMVLFGAPVVTHVSHTFLCALHLSVLTLLPLFYGHGVDSSAWLAICGFRAPFDEAFGGLVGGLAGAWLGAVPIPLDWDREWQKWPVTILCGIYAGYLVGKLVGGALVFGKKF